MVLLQTSTSQKNILLILRDRTDQTVVENWRPSRKKTILFVTSAVLTVYGISHFPGWHGVAKNDKQWYCLIKVIFRNARVYKDTNCQFQSISRSIQKYSEKEPKLFKT